MMSHTSSLAYYRTLGQCLLLWLLQLHNVYGQTASNCIASLNDLEALEVQVTDFSVVREYILCPATTFTVAVQDYYGAIQYSTGSEMIRLRPNLHLQCGSTGSRSDNCVISGGSVQMDGTSFGASNGTQVSLSNVVITGLTFTNVLKYNVWIDQPGTVSFRDCVFQVNGVWCGVCGISFLVLVCTQPEPTRTYLVVLGTFCMFLLCRV
jgi:hypothetical protein